MTLKFGLSVFLTRNIRQLRTEITMPSLLNVLVEILKQCCQIHLTISQRRNTVSKMDNIIFPLYKIVFQFVQLEVMKQKSELATLIPSNPFSNSKLQIKTFNRHQLVCIMRKMKHFVCSITQQFLFLDFYISSIRSIQDVNMYT